MPLTAPEPAATVRFAPWDWLTAGTNADAIAAIATIVAGVVALYALVETFRTRHRSTVREALTDLTSADVAAVRDRVTTLAAFEPHKLSDEENAQLRRDAYALLWTLERLVGVRSSLHTALAVNEAKLLYSHVEAIVGELSKVVVRHAELGCFRQSVDRVNDVLSLFPDVRGPWNKLERAAPRRKLHLVCDHERGVPAGEPAIPAGAPAN